MDYYTALSREREEKNKSVCVYPEAMVALQIRRREESR
jgi:hypothetical protein